MNTATHTNLESTLKHGHVYRRDMLVPFSKAIDRELANLVQKGTLEKVAGGLYYKPAKSRFGTLPPNDEELLRCFLRENVFLLFSWNQYNTLGLGLTQNYNSLVVYNRKRHGQFKLGNKTFSFRRPSRGFPRELSSEFLLVDLINNLNELDEDSNLVKEQIKNNIKRFNWKKVLEYAEHYGKIATVRFFKDIHA